MLKEAIDKHQISNPHTRSKTAENVRYSELS
jgi:hypothetical protein